MSFTALQRHPKEAAAILNRSVSAVSRPDYMAGWIRWLHRLQVSGDVSARKTRPRIDKPQRKTQSAPMRHRGELPPIAKRFGNVSSRKLQRVLVGAAYVLDRDGCPPGRCCSAGRRPASAAVRLRLEPLRRQFVACVLIPHC